jgi:hypothetical protein
MVAQVNSPAAKILEVADDPRLAKGVKAFLKVQNSGGTVMNAEYSDSSNPQSFSRRTVIKAMGMGAASSVLTPLVLSRTSQGSANQPTQADEMAQVNPNRPSDIITKEIPRTNERIPAIGLGTFLTFDVLESQPRDRMVRHMQNLPGFDRIAKMPWYPGKQFTGLVRLPNPRPTV